MASPPVLSFEKLGLVQGEGWLFRGLDIHVGPRDRLALIGRNGAGKTTLLKCLAGTIDTDEGTRTIVPGTRVVMLDQNPDVSKFATLGEWVAAGEDAPLPHDAAAIADQIGIDLDRPTATASGGERRRAAIVRALAQDPGVCCSTNRPTISISPRSTGSKAGSGASRVPSSSSATTAPSSAA